MKSLTVSVETFTEIIHGNNLDLRKSEVSILYIRIALSLVNILDEARKKCSKCILILWPNYFCILPRSVKRCIRSSPGKWSCLTWGYGTTGCGWAWHGMWSWATVGGSPSQWPQWRGCTQPQLLPSSVTPYTLHAVSYHISSQASQFKKSWNWR